MLTYKLAAEVPQVWQGRPHDDPADGVGLEAITNSHNTSNHYDSNNANTTRHSHHHTTNKTNMRI